MGRRRQGFIDDLVELTSLFPWWVGVVLAIVSYIALHQVAAMEIAPPKPGVAMGEFVGKQMYKTFAMYLQYLLPGIFLIGSAVSAFKRHGRKLLHDEVARGQRSVTDELSWEDFERLVGEHFRRRGFTVKENDTRGADGGVDLVLTRGADRYLVQCKQWRARQVGVAPIRELYGVIAAERAAGGYVVTSGVFTDEAERFAKGREIELIDGEQLIGMIKVQSAPQPNPLPARGAKAISSSLNSGSLSGATISKSEVPACPQCSSPMVLRTAKKGSNAGSSFWGCSTFPKTKCHGTRPVSLPAAE
jgi:restriction system protein